MCIRDRVSTQSTWGKESCLPMNALHRPSANGHCHTEEDAPKSRLAFSVASAAIPRALLGRLENPRLYLLFLRGAAKARLVASEYTPEGFVTFEETVVLGGNSDEPLRIALHNERNLFTFDEFIGSAVIPPGTITSDTPRAVALFDKANKRVAKLLLRLVRPPTRGRASVSRLFERTEDSPREEELHQLRDYLDAESERLDAHQRKLEQFKALLRTKAEELASERRELVQLKNDVTKEEYDLVQARTKLERDSLQLHRQTEEVEARLQQVQKEQEEKMELRNVHNLHLSLIHI
eukprot:TRINITY_DN1672_c0_g1_i1.p1 TRINITY_DN1672_c0_g1~~TRINITY_DN1672_c0_g1_i1.p1  ORF type:complete len:317 (+),score=68.87 TRINITY_DN1672_c0_g1_i1:75-953(+)